MEFKDNEETGEVCPDCDTNLVFEMSFKDCFSHKTGHYTIDFPIVVCPNCDYYHEYERDYEEYERD